MNKRDREKLFEENENLVYAAYWKHFKLYNNSQYEHDLKQEGFMELYRCTGTYDESKGYTFSTYAFNNIYLKMLKYVDRFIKQKKAVNVRISKRQYTTVYKEIEISSFDRTYSIKNNSSEDKINLYNLIGYEDENLMHAENRVLIENIIEVAKEVEKNNPKIGKISKYLELRAKGYTFLEIKNELGHSTTYIQNRLKRFYEIYRETIAS